MQMKQLIQCICEIFMVMEKLQFKNPYKNVLGVDRQDIRQEIVHREDNNLHKIVNL